MTKLETEEERVQEFKRIMQEKSDKEVTDSEAKEGTTEEKRQLLGNLKIRITYKDKSLILNSL